MNRIIFRNINLIAGLLVLAAPSFAANTTSPSADVETYSQDGHAYYAISLSTPATAKAQEGPRDVVIVFNTAASQTGPFRDTALAAVESCISKLNPQDRVQLIAADLEARPITDKFLVADSAELKTAMEKLRHESPLGATDMDRVLRAAAQRFDKQRPDGRVLFYIGDGRSPANLLDTDSFRSLVTSLSAGHIAVSSYAVGPQCDGRFLAALANQTGGNLYVAEPMVRANDAQKITDARAKDENQRNGATVGAKMAEWARATVYWPTDAHWPAELGQVYPKNLPPLRSDRDTIVIGAASTPLKKPLEIRLQAAANGKPVDLHWTGSPQEKGNAYAFLPQIVDVSKRDGGITLPTVGSAGLAETGRLIEAGVDNLTDLAERAVATGDIQTAQVAATAALARDPGNIKAKTVEQVVSQQQLKSKQVAQTSAAPAAAAGNDLNLVRPAAATAPGKPLPPPAGRGADNQAAPVPGSLTDRFAAPGQLLDETEQRRRVLGQLMRREVENITIDARKTMAEDPQTAIQNLKLSLQKVEQAPELSPDLRAQLVDKLQIAIREAQHQAAIKDELAAQRQEEQAAARERRLLNERLSRSREKEKQLVDRFDALMNEGHYDEALKVAATVHDVDPNGVTPVVALESTELMRNDYLMQLTRAERWTGFFDTLYQAEKSSVPFPDDPPIVYPAAPIWEELSNRRKDRYGSMDLKATGDAEQRIEKALKSPLNSTGLEFAATPLSDVVTQLQNDYGIPIQLDKPALDEAAIGTDTPVDASLHNISLRSALRLMLKNLQLTYIIQDEVLIITTKEAAEKSLVVKVYPVADLVLPIDATTLGGIGGGGLGGGGLSGGGAGGGGFGGGGGGFGGGGGGFGGGGGGFGGGGGGGFFSVPDTEAQTKAATASSSNHTTVAPVQPSTVKASATSSQTKKVAALAID
ncbi:MAG TPA: hypothetical protein VFW73_09760, partial [Lacipirellulaceae bacterium]|nr:hypothetical protein [Lacipirellulaceae bacterium]